MGLNLSNVRANEIRVEFFKRNKNKNAKNHLKKRIPRHVSKIQHGIKMEDNRESNQSE